MNRFEQALKDRIDQGLYRTLPDISGKIDFCSNDYLGIARSSKSNHVQGGLTSGSTGSRLISGNSNQAEQVEAMIADFHQAPAALVYSTGYMANLGLLSCIAQPDDMIILDQLAHASLIDGARLSKANRTWFRHNDLEDLEQKLTSTTGEKFVVTEALFSMDGDFAPLVEMLDVCSEHDAHLIVDEAHSIGVYGPYGNGLCTALGIQDDLFARIVTYGKAPGAHGAAILGADWLRSYLINFSRPFIFTTAPAPHHLSAIQCAYDQMRTADKERKRLLELIQYWKHNLPQIEYGHWLRSDSSIQSLIIPGNDNVVRISQILADKNLAALAIRSPSVPVGQERIRFCLHAFNSREEVDLVFDVLKQS